MTIYIPYIYIPYTYTICCVYIYILSQYTNIYIWIWYYTYQVGDQKDDIIWKDDIIIVGLYNNIHERWWKMCRVATGWWPEFSFAFSLQHVLRHLETMPLRHVARLFGDNETPKPWKLLIATETHLSIWQIKQRTTKLQTVKMPRTHCDVPLFAWHTSETWPSKVAEIAGWELDLKRSNGHEVLSDLLRFAQLNSNEAAVALVHLGHNW